VTNSKVLVNHFWHTCVQRHRLHPPRGCGKPPPPQDPLKVREAADLRRDSALSCKRWWGSEALSTEACTKKTQEG